jgi:DNA-binding response OmpR family regulator
MEMALIQNIQQHLLIRVLIVSGDCTYKNDFQAESIKRGIYVDYAPDMLEAIGMFGKRVYCLVAIHADSVECLPKLPLMRKMGRMPILMVSYSEYDDKIAALRNGAQVVLVNPYNIEFLAESCASLARFFSDIIRYENIPKIFTYKHLFLCVETHQVFYKDNHVALTKKEFNLLHYLMANKGITLTYEQIYNAIWEGEENYDSAEIFHSLIRRLRKKLQQDPCDDYISSIREVGYRFGE